VGCSVGHNVLLLNERTLDDLGTSDVVSNSLTLIFKQKDSTVSSQTTLYAVVGSISCSIFIVVGIILTALYIRRSRKRVVASVQEIRMEVNVESTTRISAHSVIAGDAAEQY
jgi:hypothetical protein